MADKNKKPLAVKAALSLRAADPCNNTASNENHPAESSSNIPSIMACRTKEPYAAGSCHDTAPIVQQPAEASSKVDKTELSMTTYENRFTWGDIGDEVSAISILKEEMSRLLKMRDDIKTLADDQKSFYAQLDERLKEALIVFDTHKETALREDRIAYWKTRGLVFMESPQYAQHAVDAFTKAVKLDPSAIDCWNNLGDCYCTLGDFEMSKKCFLSALDQKKNVVSLQNLSMLTRLKNPREIEDCMDGIKYAKEALSCDYSCNKSWAILGNAFMAAFFASGQNEYFIKKSLVAYRQADKMGSQDIDICLNKFVALKFLELYEEALNTLLPSLVTQDVEWKDAQKKFMSLVSYLNNTQDLVNKKGKLRPKRRSEYIKLLKTRKPVLEQSTETTASPRVTGIVVWILSPDDSFPYTVGLLSDSEEVLVVSILNLSTGKGFTIGDVMNVPSDTKTDVDFRICQHEFKFTKLRIEDPTEIILNGKRITKKHLRPFEVLSNN